MHIIPVIDIQNGIAVHAKGGQRQCYQPLQSILVDNCEPQAVVEGYLSLKPFKTIYIADLNTLQQQGHDNSKCIAALLQHYPHIEFWIDQGLFNLTFSRRYPNWKTVIGSESISMNMLDSPPFQALDFILSLDFKTQFIGLPQLLANTDYWPQKIIVMSLLSVGNQQGPHLENLKNIQMLADQRQIYAAGGIRGSDDLQLLKSMDIKGTLLASCLHSGQLRADDLI